MGPEPMEAEPAVRAEGLRYWTRRFTTASS